MDLIEIYENKLISRENTLEASIITVPAKCFIDKKLLSSNSLFAALKFEKHQKIRVSKLWKYIPLVFLHNDKIAEIIESDLELPSDDFIKSGGREFAEELLFGKHVIFENSPVSMESIADLVNRATDVGVGIGACIGFIIGGDSALLLLTVPAGMVICGSAAGIAKALEMGLKERLLDIFKNTKKQKSKVATEKTRRIRI
jgi:tetrahydromethanopterin S-methyltransferase subunit F